MSTLLIRNARPVNESKTFEGDLLVRHGRIDKIAPSIAASADEEIDAAGQWLLPGLMGLVHGGTIDLPTLLAKTSRRVTNLFRIAEGGYLREGYRADRVLIGDGDFDAPDDSVLSRCGWSPFAGHRRLSGRRRCA